MVSEFKPKKKYSNKNKYNSAQAVDKIRLILKTTYTPANHTKRNQKAAKKSAKKMNKAMKKYNSKK